MEKTRVIVSDVYLLDLSSKEETRVFDELVIGRAECDLVFPEDTMISRRHLRITPTGRGVVVEDLGSTNKTRLNGKLLKPNSRYKLRSRDIVEFGKQKFQVFIGGKLAAEPVNQRTKKEKLETTNVFSKLIASENEMKSKAQARDLDGMEDFSALDALPAYEENELALLRLANDKGVSWYLQFDGSEFGPLSFSEMKAIVGSQKFQGGDLFAWADGMPSWTLINRDHKIFRDGAAAKEIVAQGAEQPVPLVAMVNWHKDEAGKKKKINGTCESISPHEISVTTSEKLTVGESFEIEVTPRAGQGIERFRLTVKIDPERVRKSGYTFFVVSTPPRTKLALERYIRDYYAKK